MIKFTADNPWITTDNRRFREVSRTTPQSMNHKHMAMLPRELLFQRTVLDLGCCIGATGWWALQNGAIHYTGVETQRGYTEQALRLFHQAEINIGAAVHNADMVKWLEGRTHTVIPPQWDTVVLAGVLYGFIDPLYPLRMAVKLARHTVVIDGLYPTRQAHDADSIIEINAQQRMTLADDANNTAVGIGSRISPAALDTIMMNLGFRGEAVVVPAITDTHDAYNTPMPNRLNATFPFRYIRRYHRTNECLKSVNETVVNGTATVLPHHRIK